MTELGGTELIKYMGLPVCSQFCSFVATMTTIVGKLFTCFKLDSLGFVAFAQISVVESPQSVFTIFIRFNWHFGGAIGAKNPNNIRKKVMYICICGVIVDEYGIYFNV